MIRGKHGTGVQGHTECNAGMLSRTPYVLHHAVRLSHASHRFQFTVRCSHGGSWRKGSKLVHPRQHLSAAFTKTLYTYIHIYMYIQIQALKVLYYSVWLGMSELYN